MIRFRFPSAALLLLVVSGFLAQGVLADPQIQFIEGMFISSLSADGTVAAGNSTDGQYEACRWTEAEGVVHLGRSSVAVLGRSAGIPGISDDGERIGSTIISEDSTLVTQGRWTKGFGWEQTMPPLPPGGGSIDEAIGSVYDISGDGETVVGLLWLSTGRARASAWTSTGGIVNLGAQEPLHSSRANGANYDGSVIVGWSSSDWGKWNPTVWEDSTLTVLSNEEAFCEAKAVSPDGNLIVGGDLDTLTNVISAAMWVRTETSWQRNILGYLPGTFPAGNGVVMAGDVSADGSVVVGYNGYDNYNSTGFVWTFNLGIVKARDYFQLSGVAIADTFTIAEITSVSDNGLVFAGYGYPNNVFPNQYISFIVTFDEPSAVPEAMNTATLDLGPAYPNPFNPVTNFSLTMEKAGRVRLEVFDARGRKIRELLNGFLPIGSHELTWDGRLDDGRNAPSGIYLARASDEYGESSTRRMTLLK